MCGIAGIYNYSTPDRPAQEVTLKNMLCSIVHRGPDEAGIYLGKNIGMGSVRLSIIDISGGQQPISAWEDRYWIVFNGEIFNYLEIREELEKTGCNFKTKTDTEVVLQAYAKMGPACLNKFNGQFAISIWDNQKKELFLARDRVGIRPLFYHQQNGTLTYCSEIKGIFKNTEVKKAISPHGLSQIFTFWTTLTPNTPYEGINELPPGHYMIANQKGINIHQFWSLDFSNEKQKSDISLEEASANLRELFRDSVRIRLRADVEVAAYLSGGIDSSVTTAFIHEIDPKILNTFSIGFEDKDFDEASFQLEASKYFNTNHHPFYCTSSEIGENFYNTILHTEFPVLRTAPTPMYMLSNKVREKNIKVVITGEGADEMLAGYNIFKESKIRRFWAKEPGSAIRPLLLTKLYPYLPMMKNARSSGLKMFFGYKLKETENPYYSHLLRWHNTSRIKHYFSSDLNSQLGGFSAYESLNIVPGFENWSDLAKAQFLESTIFMSGYLLSSQGDRMAMGNSVEGRYPFLDHRIIEYASSIPSDYKLNILNEKHILKYMMKGKIPDSILKRQKQAYRAPISASFFNNNAPAYVNELLADSTLKDYGYFDSQKVNKLTDKIKSGKNISEIDNMAIAGILSTQLIHHFFIQNKANQNSENTLHNLVVIKDQ
jgi:asparagine synthase (glutamine-hydrolysing)